MDTSHRYASPLSHLKSNHATSLLSFPLRIYDAILHSSPRWRCYHQSFPPSATIYPTAQRNIPEDLSLHQHRWENFVPRLVVFTYLTSWGRHCRFICRLSASQQPVICTHYNVSTVTLQLRPLKTLTGRSS